MTEEFANKKWCPMVRSRGFSWNSESVTGVNTPSESHCDVNCRASDCMMWRWEFDSETGRQTNHGFCGLAGHP